MTATVSLRRRFLAAGWWALLARVLAGLAGFGANVLVARLLPPADVGVYFLLVSIVMLGATIAQGGLQVAVVRLAAEALARGLPGRARGVVSGTLKIGVAMAATIGVVIVLAGPVASGQLTAVPMTTATFALAGAWIVVLALVTLIAESFRGLHDYRVASLLSTALPNLMTVAALGVLFAFALPASLNLVLTVVVAVLAGVTLFAVALIGTRLSTLGPAASVSAGELLRIGWPLLVTSLAIFVTTQMDLWLVGVFCGKDEVALYGASARLVLLVMMPMLIGNVVLPPLVAELHGRGEMQRLENLVRATATLAGLVAVPVLLVLLLAAEPILGHAYGDFYRGGATVLILLCAGQTVNVLAGPGAVVLMMTGGQKNVMAISLICGALLAVGGVLAAPLGMSGIAAVAAAISGLHGLLCLVTVRRRNGIRVQFGLGELMNAVRNHRAATR